MAVSTATRKPTFVSGHQILRFLNGTVLMNFNAIRLPRRRRGAPEPAPFAGPRRCNPAEPKNGPRPPRTATVTASQNGITRARAAPQADQRHADPDQAVTHPEDEGRRLRVAERDG